MTGDRGGGARRRETRSRDAAKSAATDHFAALSLLLAFRSEFQGLRENGPNRSSKVERLTHDHRGWL